MPANKEFYKNIVDNLPEGVAICDSNQIIIDANKNFTQLSQYSKKELIGTNILEIINPTQEAFNFGNKNQTGELIAKNNEITCIRINKAITEQNNIIYLVIPFSNIAFLNQAHIDFVSTVSHELRTPLTSIKGFADTLLSAGESLNEDQRLRFIKIIKSQIDRLTRLVENLLTVSKLEGKSSKNIYKAIEVKKAVKSVLYSLQHKSKEHFIKLNIDSHLPPVWADADKFEQIFMNLIDNALKYSKTGTTVNIDAKFIEKDSHKIEIKISDQGYGIPEKFISKIFTKFSRIDNPLTRQVQGTGLGLYITKTLVDSLKGDLHVESSSDGSTFTLVLPAASPELEAKQKFQEGN